MGFNLQEVKYLTDLAKKAQKQGGRNAPVKVVLKKRPLRDKETKMLTDQVMLFKNGPVGTIVERIGDGKNEKHLYKVEFNAAEMISELKFYVPGS